MDLLWSAIAVVLPLVAIGIAANRVRAADLASISIALVKSAIALSYSPLSAVGDAPFIVGSGRLGIDFGGLSEVRDRLVVLALVAVVEAPVDIGKGIFGIDLDAFGVVRDRAVVIGLLAVGDGAVGIGDGQLLVALRDLADDLRAGSNGLVRIALLAVLPIVGDGRYR